MFGVLDATGIETSAMNRIPLSYSNSRSGQNGVSAPLSGISSLSCRCQHGSSGVELEIPLTVNAA